MGPPPPNPLARALLFSFARVLISRRFRSFQITGPGASLAPESIPYPLVVIGTHESWWDGFFEIPLIRRFQWNYRLMMEEKNLRKYPFFAQTGVFGIDLESNPAPGLLKAVRWLKSGTPGATLILYPHGRLVSPLESPYPAFQPGLHKILKWVPQAYLQCVPKAFHWGDQSRPQVWTYVSEPRPAGDFSSPDSPEIWFNQCRENLHQAILSFPKHTSPQAPNPPGKS